MSYGKRHGGPEKKIDAVSEETSVPLVSVSSQGISLSACIEAKQELSLSATEAQH